MPILNLQVNSFSNFASFYIVMTQLPCKFQAHTFSTLDKRTQQKSQLLDFQTCSGENLLTSSCRFWKDHSVFLQILHQYSVLSNTTPLYFFSSNITYFGQKQPINVQIFEIFKCVGQNSSNSTYQF